MKKLLSITIFAGMILAAGISTAEEVADETAKKGEPKIIAMEEKELVGTVVYFTPRFAPRVIGVGDDATNTDYSFSIDEKTKIEHKKSLNEIHVGNTVKVTYYDVTKKAEAKAPTKERLAKVISFVNTGKKAESYDEGSAGGAKRLVSD